MQLEAIMWLALPLFVAAGSALLAYFIMQARLEVAVAKEREALAEAQAIINAQKSTMEERIKAAQEAARRAALDELMQEFRVEERSYVRESKAPGSAKRTMVTQERMYFRNIPLSDWREHEMLVEDNLQGPALSPPPNPVEVSAALPPAGEAPRPAKRALAYAGFGAQ